MRFNINDVSSESCYRLPKALFTQNKYRELSSNAKIVYAVLKDRLEMAIDNRWVDENGDIYFCFGLEDVGKVMNFSASTISRARKELCEFGLIEFVRRGRGMKDRLYMNKIESDYLSRGADPREAV